MYVGEFFAVNLYAYIHIIYTIYKTLCDLILLLLVAVIITERGDRWTDGRDRLTDSPYHFARAQQCFAKTVGSSAGCGEQVRLLMPFTAVHTHACALLVVLVKVITGLVADRGVVPAFCRDPSFDSGCVT
ncbi:unnamed protein product, partial [Sphacelaria rigidula]